MGVVVGVDVPPVLLQVERSEQSLFYFLLTNQSKFRMDVALELTGNVNLLQHLKAEQHQAVVDVDGRLQTSLLFSPRGVCCLQDVSLKIKVGAQSPNVEA